MAKPAVVKQTEKEVPTEVLADSVIAISDGIKKLRNGRLTDRALLLLIQDAAPSNRMGKPISQREIKAVLEGIESLERLYVKKKPVAA